MKRVIAIFFVSVVTVGAWTSVSGASRVMGTGPSPAKQALEQSLRLSLAASGVHVVGQVTEAEGTSGFSIGTTIYIHGDIAQRRHLAFHVKGWLAGRKFRVIAVGNRYATALGKSNYQCATPSAGDQVARALNGIIFLAGKVQKHAQIVSLGGGAQAGTSVTGFRLRAAGQIPRAFLLGQSGVDVGGPTVKVRYQVGFWVSQLSGRIVRVQGKIAFPRYPSSPESTTHLALTLKLTANLSRYGERVPIVLPPSCNAR